MKSSNEDICLICRTKEKEGERRKWKKTQNSEMTLCKVMGCGENKLMAQQVQEAVYQIRKEDRELSWLGSAVM
jgi:nitrogen regulatory protein PII